MSNWAEPSGTLPRFDPSAGLLIPVNLASRTDLDEPASEEDDENSMLADWNELSSGCVWLPRKNGWSKKHQYAQSCRQTSDPEIRSETSMMLQCLHYENCSISARLLAKVAMV